MDSGELVGEFDPVLGSIANLLDPTVLASSERALDHLLTRNDDSLHSVHLLEDDSFDLGFEFDAEEDVDRADSGSPSSLHLDAVSEQLESNLEDMIQTAQMHPRSLQVGHLDQYL